MSKFDYECFYGDYNSLGFNSNKYAGDVLKIEDNVTVGER